LNTVGVIQVHSFIVGYKMVSRVQSFWPSAKEQTRLWFWFERRGYSIEHGMSNFAYDRREVDPDIMAWQGVLDGGPLHGRL